MLLSFAIVWTGCGESLFDSKAYTLKGVVAVGAAVEADIVVVGENGNMAYGHSNAAGEYTLSTRGATRPYLIRATAGDGRVMYSYASFDQSVVNVTPLTSYIINQVALDNNLSGGAAQLFSKFSINNELSTDIAAQVELLNTEIMSEMEAMGVGGFNHFSDVFDANHTGYDALLDTLDIEMDNDDIVIRTNNTTLDTLPYDIIDGTLGVSGQLYNVITQTGVAGATLTFTNDSAEGTATTDTNGSYSVMLENFRRYDINISATGFRTVVYNNLSTFALNAISTEMIPMIPTSITGEGTMIGSVSNARTAEGLAGVSIDLREGINNRDGIVVATGITDGSGNYSMIAVTGVYTAEFSLDGFTKAYTTVVSIGGQITDTDISIITETTAGLNNDGAFATIILSWRENPNDLDTFLTGPITEQGERFKLAYYQKLFTIDGQYSQYPTNFNAANPCASPEVVASIDIDDVSSYGPETTTICQVENGVYSYYVHHFSGSSTITDSPAQVVVTTESGITRTFIAPPGATGSTTDVWHVFDLDAYGNVTPVNVFLNGTDSVQSAPRDRVDSDVNLIDHSYTK